MQNEADLYEYKTYTAASFVIGLFITLGASFANALGLNIQKLHFNRQESLPSNQRKPDYKSGYWWFGLLLYIASQVVGSTLALEFLRAEYVAPLGSTSLIFNVIFAYLLAGTPVTKLDVFGTLTIVLGVVGVVVFGNQRTKSADFDKETNLSLTLLKQLWSRADWLVYFLFLELTTVVFFWVSTVCHQVCMARVTDERGSGNDFDTTREHDIEEMLDGGGGRRAVLEDASFKTRVTVWRRQFKRSHGQVRRILKNALEHWSQSRPDSSIRQLAGMCWAITGGVLAGQTLIFAKSGVKLVSSALDHSDPNGASQFASPLSWIIVILLVVSAVAQVYCLNQALKCYDSTLVVPVLFSSYTASAFINTLVYLDEMDSYRTWVFVCIWLSILVLVCGVIMLSLKKVPAQRKRGLSLGTSGEEEVGSNGGGENDGIELDKVDHHSQQQQEFDSTTTRTRSGSSSAARVVESLSKPPPFLDGKRQGSLGKMFGGMPSNNDGILNEQTRQQRRRGAQRLDDDDNDETSSRHDRDDKDSVFDRQSEPAELDEVDVLDYEGTRSGSSTGRGKRRDSNGDDDDVFGDFKYAEPSSTIRQD
ncbi:hypothetical protein OIO90_003299 [Microbotryomycetes sp. JL221]|nr:hypothetical protein OIO90_003299 [Microbotryomycetes sp. JL221]